jgi:uncharacterized MnhB-related membrane protein
MYKCVCVCVCVCVCAHYGIGEDVDVALAEASKVAYLAFVVMIILFHSIFY